MKAATAREGKAKGSKDERTGQEKRERTGHTHTHTHTHTHSMQGRSPWRRQGRGEEREWTVLVEAIEK